MMKQKQNQQEDDITAPIIEIFEKNRKAYGTIKFKAKLHERGLIVSRRRIGRRHMAFYPPTQLPSLNLSRFRLL
ncbi:IS3 family transposase [Paenibacillus wuxiensis]|uniref:IS3 family transposase n=1 Tax=Paenibacillaceae bacterium P-4 TaxID=3160969 RepID=UPI00406B931A